MSGIIQQVSFKKEDQRSLLEKISDHLGIQKLSIHLSGGDVVEGVVSEIGKDYISVIDGPHDTIIPVLNIKFFRYNR